MKDIFIKIEGAKNVIQVLLSRVMLVQEDKEYYALIGEKTIQISKFEYEKIESAMNRINKAG